jgi:hypothetical protein
MLHRSPQTIVLAVALMVACGGGPGLSVSSPPKNGTGNSSTAYMVPSGTVTAYRLDGAARRGQAVGTATTDANGIFQLKVTEPTTGPLLVAVSAGRYVEPATGTPVNLSGGELTAIAASKVRVAGDVIGGVVVSPVSHLVAQLAARYARSNAVSVDDALKQAADLLNSHFGGVDWQALGTVPDLTDPKVGVVQINNETKAAIILAGLSMEARNLSAARGLTPGGGLNSFTLVTALADDLAYDGFFDGVAGQGKLTIPSGSANAYTLDGQTVRGALAGAIRDFLASARNASQVSGADAEPTAFAIATDANLQIFRDSGVGPTLTNTLSFVAAEGSTHSPVSFSGQQLVSGVLNFTVTAGTPAGVASLTVMQGATVVTPGAGSAMPTKFSGTFDTTKVADGPLTFTATAKDSAGNSSTLTWHVIVDNTPPAITFTQPVAGAYYSAIVPAAAVATDANAVASLVESSLNVVNLTSAPTFSGSWTIPGMQADGQVTVQYTACDIVFNCRAVPVNVIVDRTPPVITVRAPPPRYTNNLSQTVSLTVAAEDAGAGVQAVYVKNMTSAANPIVGVRTQGTNTWTFSSIPLVGYLDNVIVAYGVDAAIGDDGIALTGNSGFGTSPPNQQTVFSLWNNTRPSPQWTPFASYYDEGNLQLALTGGDPNAVSSWSYNPSASYNPSGLTKLAVDLNNSVVVRKTTTRLGWFGASPPVSDLVGANTTNTPLIPYTIPFNAATDPPIASVTFNATVSCSGCPAFASATGNLIRDTTYSGVRYLLPVTSDAIPALAQLTGQATVSVLITATDAAGNIGQITPAQQFQFQLVPPPVALLEDASYVSGADPRSIFAFKLANNTYTSMFTNTTYPTDTARFVRFVAYNPAGKSLALLAQLGGVPGDATHPSAVVERWETWSDYTPDQPTAGNCYQASGVCMNDFYGASPCGGTRPTTYLSNGSRTCAMPAGTGNPEVNEETWPLNALWFQSGSKGEQLPIVASNNGIVVPAADGQNVGSVALYLSVTSHPVPSTLNWDSATGRYQYLYGRYDAGTPTMTSCTCDREKPSWCPARYGCYPSLQPWYLYLAQADSKVYGSLTFNTSNLVPGAASTTVLGTPSSNAATVVFSRAIPH